MTVEPPIEERLRPKRTDARWIVEYPGRNMVPPPAAEDAGCRDVDERPQHGNTHDEGCADQWPIGPITVLVKKTDTQKCSQFTINDGHSHIKSYNYSIIHFHLTLP